MNIEKMLKKEAKKIDAPDLKESIKRELNIEENTRKKRTNFLIPSSICLACLVMAIVCVVKLSSLGSKTNVLTKQTNLFAKETLSLGLIASGDAKTTSSQDRSLNNYANQTKNYIMFNQIFNSSNISVNENENGFDYAITTTYNNSVISKFYYNETINKDEKIIEGYLDINNLNYNISGTTKQKEDEFEIELEIIIDSKRKIILEQETEINENEYNYEYYYNDKLYKEVSFENEEDEIKLEIKYDFDIIDFIDVSNLFDIDIEFKVVNGEYIATEKGTELFKITINEFEIKYKKDQEEIIFNK